MSALSDRIERLEAAIGPCSRRVDPNDQLMSVLRMLNDEPGISFVLMNRLKERLA